MNYCYNFQTGIRLCVFLFSRNQVLLSDENLCQLGSNSCLGNGENKLLQGKMSQELKVESFSPKFATFNSRDVKNK